MINTIIQGDVREVLKTVPDNSIDCCVTSPPYWGLRDYGTGTWAGGNEDCDHSYQKGGRNPETSSKQISNTGTTISYYETECKDCGATRIDNQLGLEKTPEQYVSNMVEVFSEVKRVLKKGGTLWLNLGDSYAANGEKRTGRNDEGETSGQGGAFNGGQRTSIKINSGLKPKDLVGIPWMVAFALRANGWYLRQDIIWHKPNPMPESVTDRCTKAHEYIFLLSKSDKYYYDQDAIKLPVQDATVLRLLQDIENQNGSARVPGKTNGNMKAVIKGYDHRGPGDKRFRNHSGNFDVDGKLIGDGSANKKSVWTVTTKPFSEAHFATFPEDLIVDCIKAGCPENGVVLDPFMGAGTTALVARKLNRNYIGIELNESYIKIANTRLKEELGMFI